MAAAASPLAHAALPAHSSPAGSTPGLPEAPSDTPEVLVACLVQDTPSLRTRQEQLLDGALSPLLSRLAALHEDARVLVAGILYRSAPAADLGARMRPDACVRRLPWVPASRFASRLAAALREAPLDGYMLLDDDDQGDTGRMQSVLVEGLAAALLPLERHARTEPMPGASLPRRLAPQPPAVHARHLVHVLSAGVRGAQPAAVPPALTPLLNARSGEDGQTVAQLAPRLAEQRIAVCTVLDAGSAQATPRVFVQWLQAAHALLAPPGEPAAEAQELMGSNWSAPPGIGFVLSGAPEISRTGGKRTRRSADEGPPLAKRARGAPPPATAPPRAPEAPARPDASTLNKMYALQQQQESMLRNLARSATARTLGSGQASALDRLQQRIRAQQDALRVQVEQLRRGQMPELNRILQALVEIDKDAREAGIELGGPSGMLARGDKSGGQARRPGAAPSAGSSAKARPFWQGFVKWTTGVGGTGGVGAAGEHEMLTLVLATANTNNTSASLALPWPNVFQIRAILPAGMRELQQLVATQRPPCVLLSLRSLPPNVPVQGAERNEQNYRQLATMLERHQHVAYIPHGAPDCGLLVTALSGVRSGDANTALRLLALVFTSPIPFAQLRHAGASVASRGMVQMPAAPSAAATPSTPSGTGTNMSAATPGMPGMLPSYGSGAPMVGMPVSTGMGMEQLGMDSSWSLGRTQAPSMPGVGSGFPGGMPSSGGLAPSAASAGADGDASALLSSLIGAGVALPGTQQPVMGPAGGVPSVPYASDSTLSADQLRALGLS